MNIKHVGKKISYKHEDNTPYIIIDGDKFVGASDNQTGFISEKGKGNKVAGSTSILSRPNEIRINGIWKMNDMMLSSLPSTIYTPIPVLNSALSDIMEEYADLKDTFAEIMNIIGV